MGFAFPKEERADLVASRPDRVRAAAGVRPPLPLGGRPRLDALDVEEMRELVLDAWRMVVPKKVARAHLD